MSSRFTTNEYIIKYIIEELNPFVYNNLIETIHDPVMGYAGFLLQTLYYLNLNYPNINWDINKYRISGCELNTSVYNIAINNIYQNTKLDMTNTIKNMDCINLIGINKYDIIMADLPKHEICIHSYNQMIFMKYIMKSLAVNGRAAVIVSNKFLTSNKLKYIKVRQYLLKHFNLHHVIKINKNQVDNEDDNDKEYILFFNNNGKTDTIDFYNIIDTCEMTNYESTVTYETISENNYIIYNYISQYVYPESTNVQSIHYLALTPSSDSSDEISQLENQLDNIII